jgi:hypothetical protein
MRQIDDGWFIKFDRITAVSFHILLNRTKIHTTMAHSVSYKSLSWVMVLKNLL